MEVENENNVTTRFGLSMSKEEISKKMFNEGDSNAKEMASLCDKELAEFLNIDDNNDDDVKLVMEKPIPKKKQNSKSPKKTKKKAKEQTLAKADNSKCNVTFSIPEFTSSCEITFPMNVDESSYSSYDMIIGRDLQNALGIDILWSKQSLMWDGISVPMKGYTERSDENKDKLQAMFEEIMEIEQEEELYGASKLLDAKYEKADINADVEQMNHLSAQEKTALKSLLYKYEELFDGTLGTWNIPLVDFKHLNQEVNHSTQNLCRFHSYIETRSAKKLIV
ncbi:unnamed protein product [Cylindrotheca closterium]|uniref:Uncharacterized protein n=1 Tax=Cylindrotheca closterium TaxID=2856 RepID=A0AAD2FXB4_9STRA|nr:unnamed protein product [Cylindrotheca closterium]